ncbi:MAG: dipicolinate synthase subunit DpsA [Thermoanaerobacterales bacterium]|nr:dipicolinate synthase subunit DpsA [Thermoanaerobacterales bacterium]
MELAGLRISILGGDNRGIYAAAELAARGADVLVYGLPLPPEAPAVKPCDDLRVAFNESDALVIPLPGFDDEGRLPVLNGDAPLVSKSLLALIPSHVPVFSVFARPFLRRAAEQLNLRVIELVNLDEFAIWNSIPSAEGAIQMAMDATPITIHGSASWVLGFGRTGMTLARMLAGIGAKVTVVARNPAARARAEEMGYAACSFETMRPAISSADIIFNTVPALVLDEDTLSILKPAVHICDLASAPGGTDFGAAARLGIQATLAPSLPGKVAPKTAGQIMARIIARLLLNDAPGIAKRGGAQHVVEGR